MKAKAKTRADLQREIVELKAQMAGRYHYASAEIHKAGSEHMMASGVLVQLHALGGREITVPFVVRDGLSDDTIAALRRDIARSYATATELKPKE